MAPPPVLPVAFFRRDVLTVARELLGQVLVRRLGDVDLRVTVAETEAYHERERGAHTYGGRRTARNEVMFGPGGAAYVFFVYGVHWQFNVVTGEIGSGEAVLVRGAVPDDADPRALALLAERRGWGPDSGRKAPADRRKWLDGPGKLTQGLAIDRGHNGLPFTPHQPIWFEAGPRVPDAEVAVGPRVGIDYAGEDAALPWRFRWLPAGLPAQNPSSTGSRSSRTPQAS